MFTTPELNLDNPYNINRYHNVFFKSHPNVFIGEGFKRTNSYESIITEQQFLKKRNEYWETQIFGDQEVWIQLKQVIDTDEESAKRILEMLTQLWQKTVFRWYMISVVSNIHASRGNRYWSPIFAINLPVSYSNLGIIKLNNDFEERDITLQIRSVR